MTARRLLPIAAALVASLALTACGSTDDSAGSDKAWSFVSGNGKTVTLDHTPKRIIASGAEAAALLSFGIKPVGIYANSKIEDDANLQDLDLSGIEILGEAWGEIDAEKAAELKPDLIVADWWPAEKAYSGMEEGTKASSRKIAKLAPFVGIEQGDSIETLVKGYEKLAVSLGADVDSPAVAQQKQDFEKAQAAFAQAVEAKPGLSALAVSPADDLLYVANPATAPELQDFQKWGLDVVTPNKIDPSFIYWENLSWEKADKYQPDLLLIDDRSCTSNLKLAEKQPTWSSIKAAKAGATAKWPAYWMHTYGEYAAQLQQLTAAVEASDPDLT